MDPKLQEWLDSLPEEDRLREELIAIKNLRAITAKISK